MKKIALIAFVLGVLVLVLLFELPANEIKSLDDLEKLETNSKVFLKGKVESERLISEGRRIFDVKGIDVVCDCADARILIGKEVEIEGIVSEYEGEKQVTALKIFN